jgi:hypothetical protein
MVIRSESGVSDRDWELTYISGAEAYQSVKNALSSCLKQANAPE